MNKTLLLACALAGGLFAALVAPPPAQALPSVNLGIEKNADAVTPVARRGGFRGRGGVRMRGFRGRGGVRMRGYRGRRGARVRGYRRGRVYGYKRFRKRRFRLRRPRRLRRFYYGYYAGRCAWLRRRALRTDSPYWWDRYYRCRDYYY